jgi:hypothetical protein
MRRLWAPVTLLAAALVVAAAAEATPPSPVSGTETITGATANVVRVADGNTIVANHLVGTIDGSFTGTFTADYTAIVHPTGQTNVVGGTFTCACSIQGRSGTITFRFEGSGTAAVSDLHGETIGGTGGLADLHSNVDVQVVGAAVTYAGTAHFDP